MPVEKDASGRRSVRLEFEVPGTPEDVWQAIATGPGISSWFVPTEVEERDGGAVVFHHLGDGADSSGTVTAWQPPRRFAYEEKDWSPGAPPLATEFSVEARGGGTCVVRLVHSVFASTDDWDNQFTGFESGWASFFDVLRLYLTRFRGQRCSPFRVMGNVPGPEAGVWETMAGLLGLAAVSKGERRSTPVDIPPLAGFVERVGQGVHTHEVLLRLDEPAPGVALIGVYTWGGTVHPAISFYLFGDRAPAAAARDEPLWHAWMNQHFAPARKASTAI
ncbi:MAG: hypothetical protein JWO38_3965 [Gemmataceae bacterium]|nr:hypothetical protein [Gemmataceae bacterium]